MENLILIIHIIASLGVIGLVLIQHGKGADAGAAFGSGASSTVFGAGGSATFLTKITTVIALSFFLTSLSLAYFASKTLPVNDSLIEKTNQSQTNTKDLP